MKALLLRRTSRVSGWEFLLIGLLLSLIITVVHGERIQQNWSQYHWEDQLFFDHGHSFIHSLDHCFTRPALWPGLYRPLTTNCYYLLGGWLFDHQIEIYHAINIALYLLNGLLFYRLVCYLLAPLYALLAAGLWVSRHAHAELITNSAEFQVLAATSFALAALALFAHAVGRHQPLATMLVYGFMILALLSKEASVAVAAILPIHRWLFTHPFRWPYLIGPLVVAGGWLLAFLTVLRGISNHQATGFHYTVDPGMALYSMAIHFWSFFNLLTPRQGDVVLPAPVQAMAAAPSGQAIVLLIILVTALLLVARRHLTQEGRVLTLGHTFFLLGVLPYSFFTDRFFLRYGYFCHLGLALATAALAAWWVAYLSRLRLGAKPVDQPTQGMDRLG